MEPVQIFLLVAVLWLAIGVATAYVMGRRGHGGFGWLIVGAVLGPLALALAVDSTRRAQVGSEPVGQLGDAGEGPVDVLVGIDGSPESSAALRAACDLLGPRLGRLTLAAVVSYEAGERTAGERAEAVAMLQREATAVSTFGPGMVVLSGPPAETLVTHSTEEGYHLLAVGTRGRGLSKALLGSVASHLVRRASVPVLVAGQD